MADAQAAIVPVANVVLGPVEIVPVENGAKAADVPAVTVVAIVVAIVVDVPVETEVEIVVGIGADASTLPKSISTSS